MDCIGRGDMNTHDNIPVICKYAITKYGISVLLIINLINHCIITTYYTTLYRPATALGFLISACRAAADASISRRLISRTACSTCKAQPSASAITADP